MTRRTLLQLSAAPLLLQSSELLPQARLRTKTSKDISASPLSVGFETLDRKMFDPERTYPYLAKLGVKWARCQTGWARTETRKGEYDFSWLDRVVDSLRGLGIQPWFNLGYGNRLYTPAAPHETAVGWAPFNSEEAKQAWTQYVAKLATHFRDRVHHWELWNEPNGTFFWQPDQPSPQGYTDLVKLTAPVLRKQIPGVTLIGGAFVGIDGALPFAQGCFELGLADLVDKISYHPYRAEPELNYKADVRALRGLLHRYRSNMALWQGENGAPSTDKSFGALGNLHWDEQMHARWLLRRILTDLSLNVELTSYFHTVDLVNYVAATGVVGTTNSKGLLRGADYTPKPAYFAYQNLCSLFDSDTKSCDFLMRVNAVSPAVDINAIWSAPFVRKSSPIYAYWYPSNLQSEWAAHNIRFTVWSDKTAPLKKPVLVNLLDGSISEIPNAALKDGFWHFDNLPLQDYPLLITDLSLLS